MDSSNNTREASRNSWLYFLMFTQAVIIIVLLCVWKWEIIWPWIKGHTDSTLVVTLVATVIGALIVRWGIMFVTYLRFYTRPYITFEADFTQVFRLSNKVPNLEYTVGESAWKELETQNIVFGGNRGKLLLRGRSKEGTKGATISFASNVEVICTGDIRTLVDYKQYEQANTDEARFNFLFSGCTQLVVAPELPSIDLARYCYYRMFYGCTSLKTAPELPAMNLSKHCYEDMFNGCTSLVRAPKLQANYLADRCYCGMFENCTLLISTPALPATELAHGCYSHMFHGCTSLVTASELLAMDLVDGCYSWMFSDCTSLKSAPVLQAIDLATDCYSRMFSGCISLSHIAMMAIDNPSDYYGAMLDNTSPTGTFTKNKNATWDNEGIVPEGWEVELFDDPKWYK